MEARGCVGMVIGRREDGCVVCGRVGMDVWWRGVCGQEPEKRERGDNDSETEGQGECERERKSVCEKESESDRQSSSDEVHK